MGLKFYFMCFLVFYVLTKKKSFERRRSEGKSRKSLKRDFSRRDPKQP